MQAESPLWNVQGERHHRQDISLWHSFSFPHNLHSSPFSQQVSCSVVGESFEECRIHSGDDDVVKDNHPPCVCVCVCCLVPQCHSRAYKCFRNRWPLRLSSCYSNLKACLLEGPWAVTEIQCLVKPPIKVQRWWWPTIEFLSYLDCLFYNLVGFRGSNTWNSTDKAFLPGRWSARQIDSKSDRKSQIMKF